MQQALTPSRRRPTIREVASVAGVSIATVSRYLNGGHWVSPDAAAAVERAVLETGYAANQSARSLATGRANSVAFVLSDRHDALFGDPTFPLLLKGASKALSAKSMALVLLVAGTQEERAAASAYLRSGHVDGVLLVSSHENDPMFDVLVEANIPTVSAGEPLGRQGDMAWVGVDERGSAITMTKYLLSRGYADIAMIAGPADTPGGKRRLEGFREAMGGRFDPRLVEYGDFSMASGSLAAGRLLQGGRPFDAVFAASDSMAAGAISTFSRAGLRVPEDVAVAGFDDSGVAADHEPPITTMRQPWEEISARMVEILLDDPTAAPRTREVLPTELIIRRSA